MFCKFPQNYSNFRNPTINKNHLLGFEFSVNLKKILLYMHSLILPARNVFISKF